MVTGAMVIHYIDNMNQAISFYKDALGLAVNTESPGWSTFRVTETLELGLHTRGDEYAGPKDFHPFDASETLLVLTVDDLDAYCSRITEQGGVMDRILEPREGIPVRMGLVRDPSGNGFQVNQYVG